MKHKPITGDDLVPTPERMSRGEIVRLEAKAIGTVGFMDVRSCLLDRYWRDQHLLGGSSDLERAAARHEAGQRLAMLYEDTGHRKRLTGSYSPSGGQPDSAEKRADQITDEEEAADAKYQMIVRKLTSKSPSVASAVVNLCIHEFDPVDRKDLIIGLDILVRHWGL